MDPIISIKDVNFTYNAGKDNEFQALVNISLNIYPEEFVILFGPSGCGKSTLLNVIAGLEKADTGDVSVFGRDMSSMTSRDFANYHRTSMGMVFQQYNLITSLSVLDNVALPQMFVNVGRGKRNAWARGLLERFGILPQAHKIPTELSGGQQQRIGIARAIVNNPKILLADEPVGNLDSTSAKNVLDILADLNEKEKKTLIMVTHNPENLVYGDRIIYLKDGQIVREVVNTKKGRQSSDEDEQTIKVKSPVVEINNLMRAYHGLSRDKINILIMPYKAKIFAHHFISTRNMEETQIFEELIQRRLLGTITPEELVEALNRPVAEGGVGFNRQTAEKILRRINRVIRIAYFVYEEDEAGAKEGEIPKKSITLEKAERVTEYLLKTCYDGYLEHLKKEQIDLVKNIVFDRLTDKIQKPELYERLDKPVKEGGVGLNSKTAKAITDELELILILGFGIVQKKQKERQKMKEEALDEAIKGKAESAPAPGIDDEEEEADEPSATEMLATRIMGEIGHGGTSESQKEKVKAIAPEVVLDKEAAPEVVQETAVGPEHITLQERMDLMREKEERLKKEEKPKE